jgi:hypothetical protein
MAEAAKKRLRKDFKNLQVYSKVGMQIFLLVRISEIREFLGSFCYRNSGNFSGVPVRKLQVRKLVRINLQIANLQISLVSQSANLKSANFARKKAVFLIKIHHIGLQIL